MFHEHLFSHFLKLFFCFLKFSSLFLIFSHSIFSCFSFLSLSFMIKNPIKTTIYMYAQTGTFADPTVGRFELFFPFEAGVRFFFGFQEAFSSCGSSQSSASGWKAFEGLTAHVPSEQATRYSLSAVSTSKSPGQRCSLAAASTWTRFFREEATKRPTLFIRLRLPLMAPKRLSALLSPPATKKQRLVSFTRPCRRLACCSPLRSTLNTGYITGLGMCKVCTEAVHSVALWTRVTLGLDMCKVCIA